MKLNYPSITQFQQLVELRDYRPATKKEYVRYVCKLAEHFQCDPATLSENQIREYFLAAELGFISVLPPRGRQLQSHPHVRCVVPAGVLRQDGLRWMRPPSP